MSHTIIYNADMHIIESKFHGTLTFAEVKEFISEGARIAKENNCSLFITDYREVRLKLSTLEIFDVPQLMRDAFRSLGLNVNELKRALVVAADLRDYHFFETVTANQGQNAKLFREVDEAKQWLSEK